jgi:hypothetical protein
LFSATALFLSWVHRKQEGLGCIDDADCAPAAFKRMTAAAFLAAFLACQHMKGIKVTLPALVEPDMLVSVACVCACRLRPP